MLVRMIRSLIRRIRSIRKRFTQRESVVMIQVSEDALLGNLASLRKTAPEWSIAPVLKSNAYGHGLNLVALLFEKEGGSPFFCVDSYFEAETLRMEGIKTPLLVMGYTPRSVIENNSLQHVSFVITSLEQLSEIQESSSSIHLKIDTGMHRQGIAPKDLAAALDIITSSSLSLEGVMSHFAASEDITLPLSRHQINVWNQIVGVCKKRIPSITYYHIANSGGIAHHKLIDANCARAGIGLYGINPGTIVEPLVPALRMVSRISEIRTLGPGESVGYGGTFTTDKEMKIATVPVGYFEGVDRRLSNTGSFLVHGKKAPLLGRVSMNITSCDVTDIKGVKREDEVVIISEKEESPCSVSSLARVCGCIPYEVLIHIPQHLRRVVVKRFE